MPILAVCPYCHEGKVRAPDKALGLSATCPKCANCFTIVPSVELPAAPAGMKPAPRARAAPTSPIAAFEGGQIGRTARTAITIDVPTPVPEETTRPPEPNTSPEPEPPVALFQPPTRRTKINASPQVLLAIILAGVGLAASQVPFGRVPSVLLCLAGLILGLVSLASAKSKYRWPVAAAGLNLFAVVALLLVPSWFGLSSWWPAKIENDANQIKAVAYGRGEAAPTEDEWLDASKAAWQREDVRVKVTSVVLAPIDLEGPTDQKKKSKERYVQIRLRISNVGVTRKLEFQAWSTPPGPGVEAPQLRDGAGASLTQRWFETGAKSSGRSTNPQLFPDKFADDLLVYEAPAKGVDHLRLELPASAYGGSGRIQLLIPAGMIANRQ
jgi:hypothetical protein